MSARLAIAFVCDAGYVPWAGTALRSCLDAHPGQDLDLHLVHDGTVGAADVERLHGVVGAPATLTVHAVDPARVGHLPRLSRFGSVVWLRFLLPELLPGHDRVVYLDADTFVADDLWSLATADLDGNPVGAVANVVPAPDWPRLAGLGFSDPADVLNSGVLVMDLARMRAEDTWGQIGDTVAAFADQITWPDQDALNLVCAGRWTRLHPRFNAQNSLFAWPEQAQGVFGATAVAEAVADPAVVHFEGPSLCKPWHALSTHPWRERYRVTLARTPWAGTGWDDDTRPVRAIARLPERWQLPAYRSLVGLRDDRRSAARTLAGATRTRARAALRPAPATTPAPVDPTRLPPHPLSTASPAHRRIVQRCLPFTMGSPERLLATIDATEYVLARGVPGALAECGVWRGGSVLAMLLSLQAAGVDDRDVYLFDTFEGMTAPTEEDTSAFHAPATEEWSGAEGGRAYGELFSAETFGEAQVRRLLHATGYPPARIHLVRGPVEETLPAAAPDGLALLRLDTDWYESTRHELEHLYPRLATGGVLIVDDYGHWEGARKAADEHLAQHPALLLSRSDYTGRMAVKH
ncbi:MAG TPA: TylF/MycF/NovP-related O-methyltransferase [Iamia sp.]|nr:TylF/MycF/NovP-related O-methyltransferase [Iamia sp.]